MRKLSKDAIRYVVYIFGPQPCGKRWPQEAKKSLETKSVFFSQDCSREDEGGVVGKPFREHPIFRVVLSHSQIHMSAHFLQLLHAGFLFATCHRRIHKMLKTNLIGGNYGQLFLMVQPSMPCLTTHPHVRTFSQRTEQFWGRGSSLWVMPPSQWSPRAPDSSHRFKPQTNSWIPNRSYDRDILGHC